MPASFILFSSAAIGIALWALLRRCARLSRKQSRHHELNRLRQHAIWLEQRLDVARQERCDRHTIVRLSEQLGRACAELSRAQGDALRLPAQAR